MSHDHVFETRKQEKLSGLNDLSMLFPPSE